MRNYLVTYHGGGPMPSSPEAAEQMKAAFGAWVGSVGAAMVDPGAPLAKAKSVSTGAVRDGHAEGHVEGYTVLSAATIDAAVKLVQSHPFLTRGGTLEVSEALDLS
jgi:hypothetical protein